MRSVIVAKMLACALFWIVAPCFPQSLPDDVLRLAHIRDRVKLQLAELDNYTCLQSSRRFRIQGSRTAKKHRLASSEVLTLEVVQVGDEELYAWPGASAFESRRVSEIVAGGLMNTGNFSQYLRSLFVSRGAVVQSRGREEMLGRDTARYDYAISSLFNSYSLRVPSGSATLGYSGSFWADPESCDLLRLTVRADDIPPSLGVSEALTTIDYGKVRIGGSELLLPQAARTSLRYASGDTSENIIEFTHCRQFTSSSVLSFDKPSESAPATPRSIEPVALPGGLMVAVRLASGIDSNTARAGDAIDARVETAVTAKHQIWLPADTILHGRIRRLEKFTSPRESVLLGLEFTEFSHPNGQGLFFADFQQSDAATAVSKQLPLGSVRSDWTYLLHMGVLQTISIEEFSNEELPGVASLYFPGKTFQLSAGTRMVWKTRELGRR